jgi:hypothetical protein
LALRAPWLAALFDRALCEYQVNSRSSRSFYLFGCLLFARASSLFDLRRSLSIL